MHIGNMNQDGVLELIKTRRSIRNYLPDKIPDEIIQNLLVAGIWAPSAGNKQPLEIIIVKSDDAKLDLVTAAHGQEFIAEASVVFVICANINRTQKRYGQRGKDLYCIQDTAASIQNILLLAHSYDLGTCWVGSFDEEDVRELLEIPEHVRPVALIPIGYYPSNLEVLDRPRKSINEFIFNDTYKS